MTINLIGKCLDSVTMQYVKSWLKEGQDLAIDGRVKQKVDKTPNIN